MELVSTDASVARSSCRSNVPSGNWSGRSKLGSIAGLSMFISLAGWLMVDEQILARQNPIGVRVRA
jgi:hypothetical protein